MRLFRYRSIKRAIDEIRDGELYFSPREQLNDPIEGYVHVYWQGDREAWEGLFRNYVCSMSIALDYYILKADEDIILHKTIVDLSRFEKLPIGKHLQELGDRFLAEDEIKQLVDLYGNRQEKVYEKELKMLLHFVHTKALILCIQQSLKARTIPEDLGNRLLSIIRKPEKVFPIDELKNKISEEQRKALIETIADLFEDVQELHYVKLGADNDSFLYRNSNGEKGNELTEARQRRNWMAITVDFPGIYTEQLKEMIYPDSYVVCFSGNNSDSSMWGKYADNHTGVCLVYETDDANHMNLIAKDHSLHLEVKAVRYGGVVVERNFYESLGRLTALQNKIWLSGSGGISKCYTGLFEDKWREKYWDAFETKSYRKLEAWKHEDEYRIVINSLFHDYHEKENRLLKYDRTILKGIIFGIKTSEFDKMRLVKVIQDNFLEHSEFTFYQAEYSGESSKITVREKKLWKL